MQRRHGRGAEVQLADVHLHVGDLADRPWDPELTGSFDAVVLDMLDPAALRAYMLSDTFQLDGFKGRALTFRHWNGQMRQPIAVANGRALVTLAPVEGFLHQRNETDSLGMDEPESTCTAFGG